METIGNMSISSLLEKELQNLPLEGRGSNNTHDDDNNSVCTENSLEKVGHASMTRRGGRRNGGSSQELGFDFFSQATSSMEESFNSSFASSSTGSTDTKERRLSRRGKRREKTSSNKSVVSTAGHPKDNSRRSMTSSSA